MFKSLKFTSCRRVDKTNEKFDYLSAQERSREDFFMIDGLPLPDTSGGISPDRTYLYLMDIIKKVIFDTLSTTDRVNFPSLEGMVSIYLDSSRWDLQIDMLSSSQLKGPEGVDFEEFWPPIWDSRRTIAQKW